MSKHSPATREEFKALCLRAIGDGMIEVNVSADQVDDSVEEGLKYYRDYHYDGSTHVYQPYQITSTDIANKYVTVPDELFSIVSVYDYRQRGMYGLNATDIFSYDYQLIHQNANWLENGSLVAYYTNRIAYETISNVVGNQTPIRFNRHTNKLYIDSDWDRYQVGNYIILEGYQYIDPDVFTDVWNDRWLIRYVTAKIKQKWGMNLSKYEGIQLPGGMTLNGSKIMDDAMSEIQQLEDDMMTSYSMPVRDMIG